MRVFVCAQGGRGGREKVREREIERGRGESEKERDIVRKREIERWAKKEKD
jgi:hypothetical protein